MRYANAGTMRVKSGVRDSVLEILLRSGAMEGCLIYEVGTSDDDPDLVFVSELWESREAHAASLTLPAVRAAIAEAMPMLTGEFGGFDFDVVGSPLG